MRHFTRKKLGIQLTQKPSKVWGPVSTRSKQGQNPTQFNDECNSVQADIVVIGTRCTRITKAGGCKQKLSHFL